MPMRRERTWGGYDGIRSLADDGVMTFLVHQLRHTLSLSLSHGLARRDCRFDTLAIESLVLGPWDTNRV